MSQYKKDYEFGKLKEKELKKIVEDFFNDELIESNKRFDKYDYKGKKYLYELKSRNCNYNKYETTLIPSNKIFDKYHIFLFNFTDGLYYIKYRERKFRDFKKEMYVRAFRTGKKDVPAEYIFIPIEKLKKIELSE